MSARIRARQSVQSDTPSAQSGAARARLGLSSKRTRGAVDSPADDAAAAVADMKLQSPAKKARKSKRSIKTATKSKPTSARRLSFEEPRAASIPKKSASRQCTPPAADVARPPAAAESTEEDNDASSQSASPRDHHASSSAATGANAEEHMSSGTHSPVLVDESPSDSDSDAPEAAAEHDAAPKQRGITMHYSDEEDEEDDEEEDEEADREEDEDEQGDEQTVGAKSSRAASCALARKVRSMLAQPFEKDDDEAASAPMSDGQIDDMMDKMNESSSEEESHLPAPKTKTKSRLIRGADPVAIPPSSDSETDRQARAAPDSRSRKATPTKKTVSPARSKPATPAPQASPAASPSKVKAWHNPVSGRGTSVAGSVAGSRAPTCHIKVLCVSNLSSAMNQGGKVAHIKTVALNLETSERMLILAYGPEATKYQADMKPGRCYSLQLLGSPVSSDRPIALAGAKTVYRIAPGTSMRAYEAPAHGDDLESKHAGASIKQLCPSIDKIAHASVSSAVSLHGIVLDVTSVSTKSSMGMKVTLADEKGYVKVMFFEGRANLRRGHSMLLLGATVWCNSMTKAKEVSVYGSTFVAIDNSAVALSDKIKKIERANQLDKLVNVSVVPSGPLQTMAQLVQQVQEQSDERGHAEPVSGTVELQLDPEQPTTGNFWYNGCNKCMKKMRPSGEKDEDGHDLYSHEIDGAHADTSYTEHFLFNGRFREPSDALGTIYRFQVNDVLGVRLFNGTAEDLQMLSADEQIKRIKAATNTFRYNVKLNAEKQITSMIMV